MNKKVFRPVNGVRGLLQKLLAFAHIINIYANINDVKNASWNKTSVYKQFTDNIVASQLYLESNQGKNKKKHKSENTKNQKIHKAH